MVQYKCPNVLALFMDIERRGKERSPENGQNNFEEDCDEGEKNPSMIMVYMCVRLQRGKNEKEKF